jgi:hypothetical protein
MMKLRFTLIFAALFVTMMCDTRATQAARCSQPSAPYCATTYGSFTDEFEFSRCKSEMESYKDEVESYLSCLKRESTAVVNEYNEAVESFNRRTQQ